MRKVTRIVGRVLPLDRADVDTDQIIPAHWLKRVSRTGYAEGLFESWRRDPSFVMNDARYEGAIILVAGPNFGCGSSREHAAWALEEAGFRAVVSAAFADIFRNNSLKIGLVPVEAPGDVVARIMRAVQRDPALEVSVDVDRRVIEAPALGVSSPFALEDHARWRLLEGLDDISLALRHEADLSAYEARRPAWLPRVG
ncbi:MAG: 3-isopropylmalate dehydratase small subunit [Candidatus Limnocylindria bacterium]